MSLRVQAFITAAVIVTLPTIWSLRIAQHPSASLSASITRSSPLITFMIYAWHVFPWFIPGYYVRVLVALSVIAAVLIDARRGMRAAAPVAMSRWDLALSALVCTLFVSITISTTWPHHNLVIDLRSPVGDGDFVVTQGGRTRLLNHHTADDAQRYAVDLVRIGRAGMRASGVAPAALESYYAYDTPVVAPVDGVIAVVRDGVADNLPGDTNHQEPEGNFVVINVSTGSRVMLAHFRRGSVTVREGQPVLAGTVLGRIGNSGNSSEPHLHLQVNDRDGAPLPFTIAGVGMTRHARVKAAVDQAGANAP